MRAAITLTALLMLATPALAADAIKGSFIGPGTYATKEGCDKLAALAGGAERNVGSVPETLTEDGFAGWEGACTFRSITQKEPGKKWSASMDCHEGAEEGPESDLFERLPDGTIKVTVMGNDTVLQRCDAGEGRPNP